MSKSTSLSTILYLRQRLNGLKIYETSDLMQHINTFEELVGDDLVSVDVKIEDKNKDMILLTALTCNKKVTASLCFPHERWLEVISKEPRAFVDHNFWTNEECEHLISLAKPSMAKSKVRDVITGLENGEALQVIHYEVGKKFEPHFDGYQRIATVLMYLSDVDKGSETVFPAAKGNISKKGLSVRPKKGDALLFWSMRPDGSQDPSSQHGGCPVIKGNNWASTNWFHFQEFKNNIF